MEKSWFPLARKPVSLARESALTNQNAGIVYKYVSFGWKNKAIRGRSVWKWKKTHSFHQPENQCPLAEIMFSFKNWIFPMISTSRKKPPNKRIMFQVDKQSVSTSRNVEFALHKKSSFTWRISSVNVTKSAGNCGFGHIYWRNP